MKVCPGCARPYSPAEGAEQEREAILASLRDMRDAWKKHDDNEIVATRIALLEELIAFFEKRAHRYGPSFLKKPTSIECLGVVPGTTIACGEAVDPKLGVSGRTFCSEVCRLRAVVADTEKQRDHWKAHALKLLGEEEPRRG